MKEVCCLAVFRRAGARDLIYDFLPLACFLGPLWNFGSSGFNVLIAS